MATDTPLVTQKDVQQYRDEGYFVLKSALPEEHLDLLRHEADYAIDRIHQQMDRERVDSIGICHRGKRYFSAHVWRERPELLRFIKSPLMGDICRATIGEDAYLFWEQYVIKAADTGMKFSWHQDSGYVGYPEHPAYLTCWIPLDDVSEKNGTVHLLPYSRSGIRTYVHHTQEPGSNDMVGYFGSDPGIAISAPAGSIVCFSSLVFHRSGANTTDKMRRVYLAQYSSEIITSSDGMTRKGAAEPVLQKGELIDWRLGILDTRGEPEV